MIDIKFGLLFPWTFRFLAAIALIFGFVLIRESFWAGIMPIAAGFITLTAHEGTEINLSNKTYREYISLLLFKTGKFVPYTKIEKIFINASIENQRIYTAHTSHSSTFNNIFYNAYLKFTNGEKIHLCKTKSKDKLMHTLKSLSEAAGVQITDNS